MKKKLKCILLVDDDNDCNFFHKLLINQLECAEQVFFAANGIEALDFLKSCSENKYPKPEIIFLDINMPKMNGWEFLEEYHKLKVSEKAKMVLIMLTTSLNPDDREKALNSLEVNGFLNKYLDKETLGNVLKEKFPEYY